MNAKVYLGKRLALSVGLMALGAAMAWAMALMLLQDAAIAAGALPQPGVAVAPNVLENNPLWNAAQTLQSLERAAGGIGALLILGYGVVDRYEDELTEAFN